MDPLTKEKKIAVNGPFRDEEMKACPRCLVTSLGKSSSPDPKPHARRFYWRSLPSALLFGVNRRSRIFGWKRGVGILLVRWRGRWPRRSRPRNMQECILCRLSSHMELGRAAEGSDDDEDEGKRVHRGKTTEHRKEGAKLRTQARRCDKMCCKTPGEASRETAVL